MTRGTHHVTRALEQQGILSQSPKGSFKGLKIDATINGQYVHKTWWKDVSVNPKGDAWENCKAEHIGILAVGIAVDALWHFLIFLHLEIYN